MMFATVLLVTLAAALPNIYLAGQREREEELIFRGQEYARAIALFRRQFGRFPTSVKELLQTSGFRFLRKEYRDPMTRHGKWRFIHADASGALIDSLTMSLTPHATRERLQEISSSAAGSGQDSSAFFGSGEEIKGAFIVGVASTSRRRSVRIWNGRGRYHEWEFLGIAVTPVSAPAQQAPPGQGRPLLPTFPPLADEPLPKQ